MDGTPPPPWPDRFSQATVKQTIGLFPAGYGENARRGPLPVKQPSSKGGGIFSPGIPGIAARRNFQRTVRHLRSVPRGVGTDRRPRRRALPADSPSQATVKQTIGLFSACYGENARRGSLPVKQPSSKTEGFFSLRIPGTAHKRGLAAWRPCPASRGARIDPPGVRGDERIRSTVPVKQRSSKYSVYFQRVAAETRTADHCQSNNRQAKAKTFLSIYAIKQGCRKPTFKRKRHACLSRQRLPRDHAS